MIIAPRLFEMSGGSKVVRNLADALRAAGISVALISLYPGESEGGYRPKVIVKRERLQREPVVRSVEAGRPPRWWRLPILPFKYLDRWVSRRNFRSRLERYSDDTVVIFTHALPRRVLRETGYRRPAKGAPIFVGQHHSSFESLERDPLLKASIAREFADDDAFTAFSVEEATEFGELIGIPAYFVPNLTRPVEVGAPQRPTRTGGRRVVALARYSREKRLDLMIESFLLATGQSTLRDTWRLELYGDGPERDSLQKLITQRHAGDRVHLMGTVADVATVLPGADLNLLTSEVEGFPMSVIEAAQHGVPTMATDCGPGVRGLLSDLSGYLVPVDASAEQIAHHLGSALDNVPVLRENGERAAEAVAEYAAPAVIKIWGSMIERAYER